MFLLKNLGCVLFGDEEEVEINKRYNRDIAESEDLIDLAQAGLDYTDRIINHKLDKISDLFDF